ncbi:MAG: hypothetical protein QG609_272 [Patescibacteria group bacterium]|nr:hypothetical protein [Patescibacteria group bacterium]
MKRSSAIFIQAIIVLVGVIALFLMVRLPLTEGRAVNLSLFNIYSDPLIIYAYIASIPFFIGLYQVFKLLGRIGQNKVFSLKSVTYLRNIKYCAITLNILIVMAGLYIRAFHAAGDDPAGFLAMCIVATFIFVVIAAGSSFFERVERNVVDNKA